MKLQMEDGRRKRVQLLRSKDAVKKALGDVHRHTLGELFWNASGVWQGVFYDVQAEIVVISSKKQRKNLWLADCCVC